MKTNRWTFLFIGTAALCFVSTAMADLTWRVDFGPTSTESGWSSWNPSATSRTQTFANVDGGAESANMTATISGSGTLTTYSRNMPAASSTNLFRDGAQYNTSGGTISLVLSDLQPNQSYTVNLWNYDYSFGFGITQNYFNVTGGGNVFMGSLTNALNNSALGVPISLYDSRYVVNSTLTSDSSGTIAVDFASESGNTKINGLELIAVVPEPATIGLLGLGLMMTIWRRRRFVS